jgi:hypothetical protein
MYKAVDYVRIRKLKVVAKLTKGQKLNTRQQHYSIEDASVLSLKGFYRWVNGESRSETVESLTELIISCTQQTGMDPSEHVNMAKQLMEVAEGIRNLAYTYKEDQTTCAGLDILLEMISAYCRIHLPVELEVETMEVPIRANTPT